MFNLDRFDDSQFTLCQLLGVGWAFEDEIKRQRTDRRHLNFALLLEGFHFGNMTPSKTAYNLKLKLGRPLNRIVCYCLQAIAADC